MKRVWSVSLLFVSLSLSAAEVPRSVGATSLILDSPASLLVIPVAGHAAGAFGTFFKSDLTLINYRSTPQKISVSWLPQGSNNCGSPATTITMNQGWRAYEDFVGNVLGANGIGTLVLTGVTDSAAIDRDAKLDAFSRIWTQQPGSSGTVSQQLPAVPRNDLYQESYLIGLRQDASFRTNVGVVNLDAQAHTFNVEVYGTNIRGPVTSTVTVQPCSMSQTGIPAGDYGPLLVHVVPQGGTPTSWTAYGSSTDNTTGDGWVVHAVTP